MHRPPKRFPITATCFSLLLPALLSGCFWVPMSDWQHAVWSDDGEEVAFVQRSFEGQNRIGHTAERAHQFELYRSSESAPGDVSLLAGPWSGDIRALYFMGSAGYLVAGRMTREWPQDEEHQLETWSYDLIDLGGTVAPLAEVSAVSSVSCEGQGGSFHLNSVLEVIPSPDGSTLASLVFGLTCEAMLPMQTLSLSFLQAPGLQAIGQPIDIDTGALLLPGQSDTLLGGWLEDGRFAISNWDQEEAWITEPGEAPSLGALPGQDCLETPTTSGEFRADGRRVWIDTDGTLNFADEEQSFEFGCDVR